MSFCYSFTSHLLADLSSFSGNEELMGKISISVKLIQFDLVKHSIHVSCFFFSSEYYTGISMLVSVIEWLHLIHLKPI